MKQVMMVGAGAVGGFFGAHLAGHNPGVSFLLRPRTLQAVRKQGLTVRSAEGTFTVRPPAAADPRDLPHLHGKASGGRRSARSPTTGPDHPVGQGLRPG